MNLKFYVFCLFLYLFCQPDAYITEQVSYIVTERPKVMYLNKKFARNFSVTSRRYSRDDLLYYINMFIDTIVPLGNNLSIDIYFYEFRADRYYRTYVELHSKLCDFVETSSFFGNTLKKAMSSYSCPFPPGPYSFPNLTIPMKSIPVSFPYRQGRLICNTSVTVNGTVTRMAYITIDVEVKAASGNKFRNKVL